jgi:hypothetical protein
MDRLALAGLWIASAVLAIKTGDLPLMAGAPRFFSSLIWGYVPFVLVSISGIILVFKPAAKPPEADPPLPEAIILEPPPDMAPPPPLQEEAPEDAPELPREYLPASFVRKYLALINGPHTDLQDRQMLTPHVGKWMKLKGVAYSVRQDGDKCIVYVYPTVESVRGGFSAIFSKKWIAHLSHIKVNERISFNAQIVEPQWDPITLENCELL